MEKIPHQEVVNESSGSEKIIVNEAPEVRTEYTLLDSYGRVVGTHNSNSCELGDISFLVKTFDGYVHTSEGDFAFQGPIGEAKELLKNIQVFSELSRKYAELDVQISQARKDHQVSVAKWQSRGDSTSYSATHQKEQDLSVQLRLAKLQLSELEKKVLPYKV